MGDSSSCDVCSRPSSQFLSVKHVGQNHICISCRNNFYTFSRKMIESITKKFKVFPTTEELVFSIFTFLADPKDCVTKIKWSAGFDHKKCCEQQNHLCKRCKFRKSVFMFDLPDTKYKTHAPFCVKTYGLIQREWFGMLNKVKSFKPDLVKKPAVMETDDTRERQTETIDLRNSNSEISKGLFKGFSMKENTVLKLPKTQNNLDFNTNLENFQHYSFITNQEISHLKHNNILSKIQNNPHTVCQIGVNIKMGCKNQDRFS